MPRVIYANNLAEQIEDISAEESDEAEEMTVEFYESADQHTGNRAVTSRTAPGLPGELPADLDLSLLIEFLIF